MNDDDKALVISGLSQELEEDGHVFDVQIYRLEDETAWTLEVIDDDGTSHVRDDRFASDFAALVEAQKTVRTEGASAFMAGDPPPTVH